jgi:hypothetical protein
MTWLYHLNYRSSVSCNMSAFIPIFVLIISFIILPLRDILAERLR